MHERHFLDEKEPGELEPAAGALAAPRSMGRLTTVYALFTVASVLFFIAIVTIGGGFAQAQQAFGVRPAPEVTARLGPLAQVLLALAVIISGAQLGGSLFARFGQPTVVGQMFAGILLGPSGLGTVAPQASLLLLPPTVTPLLATLSQLAVIAYMFLVGLEFDPALLKKRAYQSLVISHASIAVPFLLGAAVSLLLYPLAAGGATSFLVFSAFCGIAMSVTAFPVLVRILAERGMTKSPTGVMAVACAAIDDVTAWCLLAVVVSLVDATMSAALRTMALTAAYVALAFGLLRPWLASALKSPSERVLRAAPAGLALAAIVSSLVTEMIGIHAIFGAFLCGVVVPKRSPISEQIERLAERVVPLLLLPIFFAYTGTRVHISALEGHRDWMLCGLVVVAACVGKFGGSTVAARFTGLPWREASVLGALMNTRGLVELIVLNLGLELGILSQRLFTMFVIMALVTTAMTTPLLKLLAFPRAMREARTSAADDAWRA